MRPAKQGLCTIIGNNGRDVEIGSAVQIGHHCIIEPGVVIGNGVVIRNHVELRSGTVIRDQCYIDSGVKSSGDCEIGYGCTLRYETIIARGCYLEPHVFCAPRVMFENGDKDGESIGGAHVGARAKIGTHAVIKAGIEIGADAVIYPGWVVADDVPDGAKYGRILARMDFMGGSGI